MWEGLFMLLALGTIMAIASFLAGILPLSLSLSQRQLRFIALLGTGVLVGTSLIVIIPEGVETMYSAHKKAIATADIPAPPVPGINRGNSNPNGFAGIERSELGSFFGSSERPEALDPKDIVIERTPELRKAAHIRRGTDDQSKEAKEKAAAEKAKQEEEEAAAHQQHKGDDDSTEGHKEGHTRVHPPEEEQKVEEQPEDEDEHHEGPHAYVSVALVLGFMLMFVVDHLPEALAPSKPKYTPLHISLSDLSRGPHNSSSLSLNAMNTPHTPVSPMPEMARAQQPRSSATTIGLIIHAFADGIALGASSTAASTSLSLIIFVAIMLHKAPAAFGLTSVLLKQGLSKRTARTHLLLFSLAAPAGAFFTWAIVHTLGREFMGGDIGLKWTTGWVLLFSGGTFLYVAMHSLTEATSTLHDDYAGMNGYMDSRSSGLSKAEIATCLVGMLIPLVTQVGHVH